jgi:hypothetical protein
MKFVLVNGRAPFLPISCLLCREPIRTGYLRDTRTRLCYCGFKCFAHCRSAAASVEKRARTSKNPRACESGRLPS